MTAKKSSIPLSTLRPYLKRWDRSLYDHVFEGALPNRLKAHRLYTPLGMYAEEPIEPPVRIAHYLWHEGMECLDYRTGRVKLKDGREARMGKVLARTADLLPVFENDSRRQAQPRENQIVVISRHPLDICNMSYGRGWTSCLNIMSGEEADSLIEEVASGSLVAYLIDAADVQIKNPSARIVLRSYLRLDEDKTQTTDRILLPAVQYGTKSEAFGKTVAAFAEMLNRDSPAGTYTINGCVYSGDNNNTVVHFGNLTRAEIHKMDNDQLVLAAGLDDTPVKGFYDMEGSSPEVDNALALNRECPADILRRFVSSPNALLRANTAINPNCPQDALTVLAADEAWDVRAAVARNKHTPYASMKNLFADKHGAVLKSIIERSDDLPIVHFIEMARAHASTSAMKILAHSRYVANVVLAEVLLKSPEVSVRAKLATNFRLDHTQRMALAQDMFPEVRAHVARNSKISEELMLILSKDRSAEVRYQLADRNDLPVAVCRALSNDPDDSVRLKLIEVSRMPRAAQHRLARDRSYQIVQALAERHSLYVSTQLILIRSPMLSIRKAIANNTSCEAVLRALAHDSRITVCEAVVANSSTPTEVLEEIYERAEDKTRIAEKLLHNQAAPVELLQRMSLDERVCESTRSKMLKSQSVGEVFMKGMKRPGRGHSMPDLWYPGGGFAHQFFDTEGSTMADKLEGLGISSPLLNTQTLSRIMRCQPRLDRPLVMEAPREALRSSSWTFFQEFLNTPNTEAPIDPAHGAEILKAGAASTDLMTQIRERYARLFPVGVPTPNLPATYQAQPHPLDSMKTISVDDVHNVEVAFDFEAGYNITVQPRAALPTILIDSVASFLETYGQPSPTEKEKP